MCHAYIAPVIKQKYWIRYDINRLSVEDRFLDNGDSSDERQLNAFNYAAGLSYAINNETHIYSNYRTSFQTPVLSELTADPLGGGGFNADLSPQKAGNLEFGLRSTIKTNISINIVGYLINTQNDLVPYELDGFPGRTFYRNAGSTKRRGLESSINYNLLPSTTLSLTHTVSSLKFDEYEENGNLLNGFHLPGTAEHFGGFKISHQPKTGFNASLQFSRVGRIFTDNNNTAFSDPFNLMRIHLAYTLDIRAVKLSPYVALNNIFNTSYFDNIRPNAFGSRYYENAAGRNFHLGVKVSL